MHSKSEDQTKYYHGFTKKSGSSAPVHWASWGNVLLPEDASGSVFLSPPNACEVFRTHFVEINWIHNIKKSWKNVKRFMDTGEWSEHTKP